MAKVFFSLNSVSLVRYLFFFIASVLFLFGAVTLLRINQNPGNMFLYVIYASLMFSDAVVFLVCGLFVERRRLVYWFAVSLLSINILGTIFDQVGLVDLLFVLLCAIIL